MNSNKPVISVIMPSFNRQHGLREILEAYDRQTVSHFFELIVVDDASTDKSWEILSNYKPKYYDLHIFKQEKNHGPGVARNIAISHVNAPLIVFVGDDILPSNHFLQSHLKAHQIFRRENVAILGHILWAYKLPVNTLMQHIDGLGAQQFGYYHMVSGQYYDFRHFYTSNVSIKTELIRSLDKYFDEDFEYAAFEDAEISWRLYKQKQMQILYLSDPTVQHYHYHNIYTFSRRQVIAGKMGSLLARKHTELEDFIFPPELKEINIQGTSPSGFNDVDESERKIFQIANTYEWHNHYNLNLFYKNILTYFYIKGWVEALYVNDSEKQIVIKSHIYDKLVSPIISVF